MSNKYFYKIKFCLLENFYIIGLAFYDCFCLFTFFITMFVNR